MRKKKGFTLIELLGVIVVLSVILIIAVPKILDVIENAEKSAYKESVELMAHTAQLQYNTSEVDGKAPTIPEGGIVYTFEEGEFTSSDKLNFKGDKPFSGTITLTKDKKVIIDKLVSKNKKWCAIKEAGEKQAKVGRSTDPDFACIIEEDKPVVDVKACELAEGTETINGEEKEAYYIDSVCDMYEFSYRVNNGESFSGKVVKVRNDLDMSNINDISSKLTNKYGTTDFSPIGTSSDLAFSGTFDGGAKKISNLTINKPSQNYVGLFGYVIGTEDDSANIYGVRIVNDLDSEGNPKASISGKSYVGSLIGYVNGNVNIMEIEISNSILNINEKYGASTIGYIHSDTTGNISNILVKNAVVKRPLSYAGYLAAYNSSMVKNSIVENLELEYGSNLYTTSENNNTYYSANVTVDGNYKTDGFVTDGIDDLNFYEAAGLDTWIGGDNDNSGYYFDYDSNNKVVLKSTKKDPITFNLKGKGTENDPYLIENENDWKEVSSRPLIDNYYKLVNDLDFSVKKYYMLGSINNSFAGDINGDMKQISNAKISASEEAYIGLFGNVVEGSVHEFNIIKPNIRGKFSTSVIGHVSDATVYAMRVSEGSFYGYYYTGGLIGSVENASNISEIELTSVNINATGNYGASAIGYVFDNATGNINNILVKNAIVKRPLSYAGYLAAYNSSMLKNSIVENLELEFGSNLYTTSEDNNTYYSANVTVDGNYKTDGFVTDGIDDLNFYEAAGLDTWIGGDNDESGYYFDYDDTGKVVLKSTKKDPITFNLKGSGTENDPYLIENEDDWKEVSSRPHENKYYKVTNNLDFSNKKYYMLGSINNSFSGDINGDMKQISNAKISASEEAYIGLFGNVVEGSVHEFDIIKPNIRGKFSTSVIGHVSDATVYAIKVSEGTFYGYYYTGGLIGSVENASNISEIELTSVNINATGQYGASAIGYIFDNATGNINNILVKNAVVKRPSSYAGYLSAYNSSMIKNSIVENLELEYGSYLYTTSEDNNTYYSANVTVDGNYKTDGFVTDGIDDINFYEAAGLDTWIGGDNNSSGYYFDYDSNNKVVLKSTKKDPITFNLKGNGTENDPYLIENENDWKEVSSRPLIKAYYKVINNLDFSTNKYYMLGSINNSFAGDINGDMKQISNAKISASEEAYIGLFGNVVEGSVHEFDIIKPNIRGKFSTSVIGHVSDATVYAMRVSEGSFYGYYYTGGLIGSVENASNISEIELTSVNINATGQYGASAIGYIFSNATGNINNILVKNAVVKRPSSYAGYLSAYNSSKIKNSIVENLELEYGSNLYTTSSSYNTYHSNNVKVDGNYKTDGFSTSLIGDLDYYTNIIETLYNGDANGTGYFFDYVDDTNGIRLVKAYTPVETETPTEQPNCTITYGEVEHGCYLYKSGVHGNYLYWAATSEDTGTGAACTGTGRDAAYRQRIYYNCN